jgi:hypothetical protein
MGNVTQEVECLKKLTHAIQAIYVKKDNVCNMTKDNLCKNCKFGLTFKKIDAI